MKIQEALNPQDFLTLLNASFGILSIFFSVEGNFLAAAILMLLAVAFDYLDGKLGRIIKRTHKFGKELDSLCDVVSFGIAPSVFGYTYHEYIY
ncbi:MAG: CDP-alcohol phosphatidyltransferase family protein, partial [Candidatus Woesearchaeota archaeon]|nr:CDP-alcohol phosphatidyltransferase family protein [Candidatus Woesearchaeota archaeon]